MLLAAQSDGRDLRKQLGATAPKDESDVVTVARRTSLQARLQCIDKEVPALHAELALYEAEDAAELVRLRRDLLAQKISLAEQRIKRLTESLDKARRAEAERAVDEARQMQRQVEALPQLRTLAAENIRLAEELRSRTKPIEAAEHDLKLSTDLVEKLSEQFGKTREKATAVGLTETIGQLLRKQRDKLHDPADFQRSVDDRSQAIDDVQFRLYELDEIRSNVANPEIFQSLMAEGSSRSDASIAEEPGKSRPRSSRQQAAASRPAQPQPDQLLRHAAGAGHHAAPAHPTDQRICPVHR